MTQEILRGWGSFRDAVPTGDSGAQLPFKRTSLEFQLSPCVPATATTPRAWTPAHAQQDSETAASTAADGADSGNISGRCPLADRAGDAACSSPHVLGPGGGLEAAGSMVNPPPARPQFPSAARLARVRSRLLGLVGWSCPWGSAVPGLPSPPAGICHGVGAPQRYFVL